MKPYQIYQIGNIAALNTPLHNNSQLTLIAGEANGATTKIELIQHGYANRFDRLEVTHEIRQKICGKTSAMHEGSLVDVTFTSFIETCVFPAYICLSEGIVIFNASKEVCKSTHKAISADHILRNQFDIKYRKFDFVRASPLINRYVSAWFSDINTNITAANLTGHDVQADGYFHQLKSDGVLSNVTIPFEYGNAEHKVMVTKNSAVILVENYQNNIPLELDIVLSVFGQYFSEGWREDA